MPEYMVRNLVNRYQVVEAENVDEAIETANSCPQDWEYAEDTHEVSVFRIEVSE